MGWCTYPQAAVPLQKIYTYTYIIKLDKFKLMAIEVPRRNIGSHERFKLSSRAVLEIISSILLKLLSREHQMAMF